MAERDNFWERLDPRYRLILCDIWGVVHDGVELYPGAAERLRQWRREGRFVLLITNAPRTADAVEQQLGRIGLPRDAWDAVATSGEAGIEALNALARPVGFVGTAEDRAILEGRGVVITDGDAIHGPRVHRVRRATSARRRLPSRPRTLGRPRCPHALP